MFLNQNLVQDQSGLFLFATSQGGEKNMEIRAGPRALETINT
nr:MAG TPA: hypothetical protein [Caudoviricetes sp.]